MKILHVITGLKRGGAELKFFDHLLEFQACGYEQYVLSFGEKTELNQKIEEKGFQVQSLHFEFKNLKRFILNLKKIIPKIKHFDPDIIHGWMYHGILLSIGLNFLLKKVFCVWNIHHSLQALHTDRFRTRILISSLGMISFIPHKIIYCASSIARQHEQKGYRKDKRLVIPNGYDDKTFFFDLPARNQIRNEQNISPESFVVGFIGRYHKIKGIKDLLQSFYLAHQQNPQLVLMLIGAGCERSNKELTDLIRTLGIESRVFLFGERNEIRAWYSSFDLFVLSSLGEAFPSVLAEAMLCETPHISTDVGDVREISAGFGIIVPPGEPTQLAEAIVKISLQPESERKIQAKLGREHIQKTFTEQNRVQAFQSLYESAK